jgi:hypothetical protein
VLNLPSISDGARIKSKLAVHSISKLHCSMLNDAGEMTIARTAATRAHTAEQLLSVLVVIEADVAEGFFVVVHYFDFLPNRGRSFCSLGRRAMEMRRRHEQTKSLHVFTGGVGACNGGTKQIESCVMSHEYIFSVILIQKYRICY